MVSKEDFIERFAKRGYTKHDSGVIYEDFLSTLEDALVKGESVMFRGFGTFEVRERAERRAQNPQTKEMMVIPSYRTAHFTPGKRLKRGIKEGIIRE